MRTTLLLFGILAITFSVPALAQSVSSTSSALIAPSHLKAAETMLSLTTSTESYNQNIDQKLKMMFKQLPDVTDKEEAQKRIHAFISKYLSWESVRAELVVLYARKFTEAELQDIIKFYQTPTGQKLAVIKPQLSQAQMEIGQRRLQEHMSEFQQLFEK